MKLKEQLEFLKNKTTYEEYEETVKDVLKRETGRTECIFNKVIKDGMTYEEVAKQYNITRERVRQIVNKVLRKISYYLYQIKRTKMTVIIKRKIMVAVDLANGDKVYGYEGECPFCKETVYKNWCGPVNIEKPDNIFCHRCGSELRWIYTEVE